MSSVDQLKDMFPSVEARVVEALVIASGGAIEPATNALLYLSDPNSHVEVPSALVESVPAPPPRPSGAELERRRQMQADEDIARQLARSYQKRPQPRKPASDNDSEDDIVDAFNKNLNEAKNVVGGWLDNVAKRLQGDPAGAPAGASATSSRASHENLTPHYREEAPPRLPARKSTQLYSALDTGSKDELKVGADAGAAPSAGSDAAAGVAGITLTDVTGDDAQDDEPVVPAAAAATKNDKKWESLTAVAPEPTVGTSKVTASADDSGFVVDDSEDEEEPEKEAKEPEETAADPSATP